jgi:D-beta-D-heptose 7-phosphate kinase/D-beta-D-heptose 1-phosphate adenosyltransferase
MFDKFITNEEVVRFTEIKKSVGKKIVFTNGVYDLLHIGHIEYLKKASLYGDCMVVAVNSDNSTRKLKGNLRPIIHQEQRAKILSYFEFVNFVTIFDEITPIKLIEAIKPDFLIKGADWKDNEIVGKDFVEDYGGRIIRINLTKGISTSKIIDKIILKHRNMVEVIYKDLENKNG